jgi:FSR family fosmidomycin resistance protein-like MFS transporter
MAARTLSSAAPATAAAEATVMAVILATSAGHFINDTLQSVLTSIYPVVKGPLGLSFAQIGLVTLAFQLTASILQPLIGLATDRRPQPFSLPIGMAMSLLGVLLIAAAQGFWTLLLAATLIGTGSAVFHPEASRVARLAAGGRYGMAQSVFQVGGNSGQAVGPLLVALIVVPFGQAHAAWFALAALIGILLLTRVGVWYGAHLAQLRRTPARTPSAPPLAPGPTRLAIAVLVMLTFSKNFYMSVFASYYPFLLIERFGLSVQAAQVHLFLFLGAAALGTFLGGPVGDRLGGRAVMWASILGVLPLTLALPFASLWLTAVLAVLIGLLMAAAFPAIVVHAQELLPGRVGMIAGLFFGLAFGTGGIGAALAGWLADLTSLDLVFKLCGLLPALGLAMLWLPRHEAPARA